MFSSEYISFWLIVFWLGSAFGGFCLGWGLCDWLRKRDERMRSEGASQGTKTTDKPTP